ncbi:MAG: GNAT family N-acetyltransferase [Candidatus Poribacteria bacterium]|jgi:ribosomal protein S18 acetylase RimI-like enzyme|nr:GNAT family N-acetyltransferase [Candidatus Poribacteria bacterium]MDP6746564.1 GNAT family N-acetyltransferase [Candidatus Poribacteria bacterium]MDP6996972.1 GNAT family N-acetyltransferase [Candidatus Poribacteria bacterium]
MIRRYCPTDLETLRQITVICFEHVSIDKNIEDHFGIVGGVDWKTRKALHIDMDAEANPNGIFVAEIEDKVVGYITTRIDIITKIGQIPNLAVLPDFQQKGLGQQLIQVALDYFKTEGMAIAKIETLAQNPVGTIFYPKMGFVEVARQIHYVQSL